MARKNKKNASQLKEEFKQSMTNGTPAPQSGARWDSKTADRYNRAKSDAKAELKQQSRRSGRRADRSPRDTFGDTHNATVSNMSIESPVANSRTLLFPTDSASMQSFGSRTTTPGQDNFIENFNLVYKSPLVSGFNISGAFEPEAKRTSNACLINVTPLYGATGVNKKSVWTNPLSLAGVNLKQYIDTSFGTNTNYNPQDLTAYLIGVADIFSTIAEIKRDLRLALTVQEGLYPQFTPRGLFTLLHITDGDNNYSNGEGALYTAQHLREWIDQLNQSILAFNRLPIPPEITMFGYNDDLFSKVYMDSPDESTAQLYIFQKDTAWKYSEEENPEGAMLIRTPLANLGTVGYRIEVLNTAIAAVSALRTDSRAMLQNLYNAYGSKDTLQIPTLDYTSLSPVEFEYNELILTAIENMTICDRSRVEISPIMAFNSENKIEHHVYVDLSAGIDEACIAVAADVPLQFHKPAAALTADDIGAALRFHASFRNLAMIQVADSTDPSGVVTKRALTADGYIGFALVSRLYVATLKDDGTVKQYAISHQMSSFQGEATRNDEVLRDFHQAPVFKSIVVEDPDEDNNYVYTLESYTANRDTELTYRLDDLQMHWTYLTQTVWGDRKSVV